MLHFNPRIIASVFALFFCLTYSPVLKADPKLLQLLNSLKAISEEEAASSSKVNQKKIELAKIAHDLRTLWGEETGCKRSKGKPMEIVALHQDGAQVLSSFGESSFESFSVLFPLPEMNEYRAKQIEIARSKYNTLQIELARMEEARLNFGPKKTKIRSEMIEPLTKLEKSLKNVLIKGTEVRTHKSSGGLRRVTISRIENSEALVTWERNGVLKQKRISIDELILESGMSYKEARSILSEGAKIVKLSRLDQARDSLSSGGSSSSAEYDTWDRPESEDAPSDSDEDRSRSRSSDDRQDKSKSNSESDDAKSNHSDSSQIFAPPPMPSRVVVGPPRPPRRVIDPPAPPREIVRPPTPKRETREERKERERQEKLHGMVDRWVLGLNKNRSNETPTPVVQPTPPIQRNVVRPSTSNRRVLSKEQCDAVTFDNRDRMAPDQDQKRSSLCWAHATAALLEEQLCHAQRVYCKDPVSRSEVAARPYDGEGVFPLASNLGGSVETALRYYLTSTEMRVCLQRYGQNPFGLDHDEFIPLLKKLYRYYQAKRPNKVEELQALLHLFPDFKDFLEENKSSWTVYTDKIKLLDEADLLRKLKKSNNEDQFAQDVLLFYCSRGRKSFNYGMELETISRDIRTSVYNPRTDSGDYRRVEVSSYLGIIEEAKRSEHSMGLSLCYNPLVSNLNLRNGRRASELDSDGCGAHAVVVNALEWNDEEGKCKAYVKNSHGPNATLKSDWYDAETIFAHTYNVSFVGKK